MSGIYKITNPNGKIYIGQSVNPIQRLKHYKRLDCREQPKIYNSLIKYGIENHVFEVIHFCRVEELNHFERYYQELYNVIKNGLNCRLTITTDKSGYFSDETKLKMSIAQKGRVVSEEIKLKMSIARKGTKKGLDNPFFNKKHNKQSKLRMSNARKGTRLGLENNNSRIILDLNNGVFYYSVNELTKSINFSKSYLSEMLRGSKHNKTQFIYV
jgi:group I intron endonuclease